LDFYLADDDGNVIKNSVRNDNICWVHINGEIKEINNMLCVGYAIYNNDGILLYWSYQIDTKQEYWPILHKGICKLKSKIPKRFLNEDNYYIELICSLHFRFWIVEPGMGAPSIQLSIIGGLSDSPYFYQKRPGALAPIIPWEN
jgi:lipopolysaccharide transport system ATP-binding protein